MVLNNEQFSLCYSAGEYLILSKRKLVLLCSVVKPQVTVHLGKIVSLLVDGKSEGLLTAKESLITPLLLQSLEVS